MAININQANLYFSNSNHIKHSIWADIDDDDKQAAIGHAKRLIALILDTTINESTTSDSDFPRHDIAVYEQALWMLEQSQVIPNGDETAPKFIGEKSPDDAEKKVKTGFSIAPEAARFLTRNPMAICLVRG